MSTKKHLQRFLRLTNYYQQFILHFSIRAAPLTELWRKRKLWILEWTLRLSRIYLPPHVKKPILQVPQPGYPFLLFTDAPDIGLGVVLTQHTPEREHPIQYLSWKLSEAERKYAVIEKEALAIKWMVDTHTHTPV